MKWSEMSKIDKRRDILIISSFILFLIGSFLFSSCILKIYGGYMPFVVSILSLSAIYKIAIWMAGIR